MSKTLKGNGLTKKEVKKENAKPKEDRYYANRSSVVHAVLADRMAERDPGNRPQSNDRIQFVYIVPKGEVKLQGDRVEHIDYVIENKLQVDYLFYITNQIMKPAVQFLECMTENPKKIFEKYIVREENRRKGQKPIAFYFESNKEEIKNNTYLDSFSISKDTNNKVRPKKINRSKNKKNIQHTDRKYMGILDLDLDYFS